MRKILVIEDNMMNREILKDILSEEYEVLEAENGAEGLDILENHHQDLSLILLDLQMPVMDGFTFLERVQGDALLSAVPVIVMTADENGDTEERCMQLGAVEFLEKPYNPAVMFGRIRNMIRMREAAFELHSIEYDELTGLYTRQAFYHYARQLFYDHPDRKYSLMITDVCEFKQINELYGEKTGQEILRAIADKLRKDTEEKGGIAGYYGENKFATVFETEMIPETEKLNELIEGRLTIANVDRIRIKLGIYENVDPALSLSLMCDRALSALDTVRDSYDHYVGTYDGPLAKKQRMDQQMELDFFEALEKEEFKTWFQPKVDPMTGEIVGAEALVRWQRADGSFIAPYLFIPLFEKDGYVADLDQYMFRHVCLFQKERMTEGRKVFPISVNMSRATLLRKGTIESYRKLAEEIGVPKSLVPLEITESAAFLNQEVGHRMVELKEAGFPLDMDDFGSGYSSLTSLGILPFDVTKLDKSLADNIGTKRGCMIVRHMLEVIRELGMKSVVEGVETKEQVEILKTLGCDAIQGYYYSKPLPLEEFDALADKGFKA